ncbi:hypothetical protein [Anthocerotibacter panamensis]|uniref:hypothetical protein n=1 Tax=Anthocerotibacter panamensis TaxID=2857077 RepID=UPI001C407640|nr:hypothetical protein [Anthocerotibacter panamensis]
MSENTVPELLAHILETYCNINYLRDDWSESVKRVLNNPTFPEKAIQFRKQLVDAILLRTITPNQYEKLTDEDFDTPEELEERLRELWKDLYGDEPVSLTDS